MNAARQLSLLDVDLPAPVALVDDDAPRITAEEHEAFAAWRRAHPPAPSMAHTEHTEWMDFLAARLLAEMRERAIPLLEAPAPTTSTERDR